MILEKNKTKKKAKPDLELIPQKPDILPLKFDIYRKLSHLVVVGITLFYFILGFLVQNIFVYIFHFLPDLVSNLFFSVYNIESDKMVFTQYLVVFLVGISLIGLLTADIVRILFPDLYPLKPVNQILRKKEMHLRFGPQISMSIGCFSIIIMYGIFQPIGPIIICCSMIMTIFGDMTANLLGRMFGSKNIRNTPKTYEGLFSGMAVAFISGIIFLAIINIDFALNVYTFVLYPLIGAITIGILDYSNIDVDDNLTFPFVVSSILFLISFFYF